MDFIHSFLYFVSTSLYSQYICDKKYSKIYDFTERKSFVVLIMKYKIFNAFLIYSIWYSKVSLLCVIHRPACNPFIYVFTVTVLISRKGILIQTELLEMLD